MEIWTSTNTLLLLLALTQLTNGFVLKDTIKDQLNGEVRKRDIKDRPKIVNCQTERR